MLVTKTIIVALIVVPRLGEEEEENIYPGVIVMVRMSGGVEVMIEQYSLMFGGSQSTVQH